MRVVLSRNEVITVVILSLFLNASEMHLFASVYRLTFDIKRAIVTENGGISAVIDVYLVLLR